VVLTLGWGRHLGPPLVALVAAFLAGAVLAAVHQRSSATSSSPTWY